MKIGKPATVLLLSLACVLAVFAGKAYAHFPDSDGQITGVLHAEPDDLPTAGNPNDLYLIFSDSSNRFKVKNCLCNLTVSNNHTALLRVTLLPPPAGQPSVYDTQAVPFVFPAGGVYHISLSGTPKPGMSFQPFNLSWYLQVADKPAGGSSSSLGNIFKYFGAILITFVLIGLVFFAAS